MDYDAFGEWIAAGIVLGVLFIGIYATMNYFSKDATETKAFTTFVENCTTAFSPYSLDPEIVHKGCVNLWSRR